MNTVGSFFAGLLVGIILTLIVIVVVANTVPLASTVPPILTAPSAYSPSPSPSNYYSSVGRSS